ncbi:MAG: Rep family protein [Staphylococcus epidermidis]|nr:Rep family protein [Veillonella sp.]MDU1577426.1 Rep family protein [Staphylococcus epidermidis]MDU1788893.1 Rep family protein [Streptococcus thermophilus]MDU2912686.1 Rep family protein [Staphylococcus warneri]MDU3977897.1 Rep family protein [Staphylococcus sp.]MDU4091599.1 Rep family protein [Enterococcus faecalis]MDU4449291.1 Rep family protein [Staphylococcus lugdunensis]MDU5197751.1 Rep family protein [Enterobacter sichuanensis]MDU5976983.1 Rep family protein [Finegoldia magna]MDU
MTTSKRRITKFMYTQQLKYLNLSIEQLKDNLENDAYIQDFAMINHNKDLDENNQNVAEHLHVFIKLNQQKTIDYVADLVDDKAQYIEFFDKSNKSRNEQNGYLYLLHKTKSAEHKHQYSIDDLIVKDGSNIKEKINRWIEDYENNLKKYQSKRRKTVVQSILNDYADRIIDEKELKDSLTNLELAKNKKLINDIKQVLIEFDFQTYLEQERYKNKQVVWIFGKSSTGKSMMSQLLAKDYISDINDIYVTSSNRDPFEDYQNQKVLIIEEFRNETNIGTNELLQLLDKTNGQVRVGSRYSNKKIMADLIIINTIYEPKYFMNFDEPIYQLLRRIDKLVKLDNQKIETLEYDSKKDDFNVIKSIANNVENMTLKKILGDDFK